MLHRTSLLQFNYYQIPQENFSVSSAAIELQAINRAVSGAERDSQK
jgi:hypothetical protein